MTSVIYTIIVSFTFALYYITRRAWIFAAICCLCTSLNGYIMCVLVRRDMLASERETSNQ